MTTYHSGGQEIATGTPFMEVRTTADNRIDLLDELWSVLPPELRIAAAAFVPGGLTSADIRQASEARA